MVSQITWPIGYDIPFTDPPLGLAFPYRGDGCGLLIFPNKLDETAVKYFHSFCKLSWGY